jgi:hypothetical protein
MTPAGGGDCCAAGLLQPLPCILPVSGCDKRWYLDRRGSVLSRGSMSSRRSRPPSNRHPRMLVPQTDPLPQCCPEPHFHARWCAERASRLIDNASARCIPPSPDNLLAEAFPIKASDERPEASGCFPEAGLLRINRPWLVPSPVRQLTSAINKSTNRPSMGWPNFSHDLGLNRKDHSAANGGS